MARAPRSGLQIASLVMGLFIALPSLPCFAMMASSLIFTTTAQNLMGEMVATAIFGALSVMSVAMIVLGARRPRIDVEPPEEWRERQVLAMASEHEGVLSVGQLAMLTDMNIATSQAMLESLERRGIATSEFSPQGGMIYHFTNLAPSQRQSIAHQRTAAPPVSPQQADLDAFDAQLRDSSRAQFDFESRPEANPHESSQQAHHQGARGAATRRLGRLPLSGYASITLREARGSCTIGIVMGDSSETPFQAALATARTL